MASYPVLVLAGIMTCPTWLVRQEGNTNLTSVLVLELVSDYPTSPTRRVGHAEDLLEEVHTKDLLKEVHANTCESEVRRIPRELIGKETKGTILGLVKRLCIAIAYV